MITNRPFSIVINKF